MSTETSDRLEITAEDGLEALNLDDFAPGKRIIVHETRTTRKVRGSQLYTTLTITHEEAVSHLRKVMALRESGNAFEGTPSHFLEWKPSGGTNDEYLVTLITGKLDAGPHPSAPARCVVLKVVDIVDAQEAAWKFLEEELLPR